MMNDAEYLRDLAQRLLPARETSDEDTTRLMACADELEDLEEIADNYLARLQRKLGG